jgi:hypothetical protein
MTDRFRRANSPTTLVAVGHIKGRDQRVTHAVVSAGAFIAFARGHLENACARVPGTTQ